MFQPLNDNVLISQAVVNEKTPGGIIIPERAKEKPSHGDVAGVGNDCKLGLQIGDKVIFTKYAGHTVTVEGIKYIVVKEEEILGKIN